MIASTIRTMSRLQLLVEIVQRAHRMLHPTDQQRYAEAFAPYLKGSSGQYLYHLKGEESASHIERIGTLMHRLVGELATSYSENPIYQVLRRVFEEHFVVEEDAARARSGEELSASSLQSPDDWEATYRKKRGEDHIGYSANLTETCDPENDLQLIVQVGGRVKQHRRRSDAGRGAARTQGAFGYEADVERWWIQQSQCGRDHAPRGSGANPDSDPWAQAE